MSNAPNEKSTFSADLILSIDDLRKSNWRAQIAHLTDADYRAYWQAFSKVARVELEAKRFATAKVFWLFADACSLLLSPDATHEVFKPFAIMENGRSAALEDFSDSDIAFFALAESEIDEPLIKARICDILWLKMVPRNNRFATEAIQAYLQFPVSADTFLGRGDEYWHRAINLALRLRNLGNGHLATIAKRLFQAFENSLISDSVYVLLLSSLLLKCRINEVESSIVISKLTEFSENAVSNQDWHFAVKFCEAAIDWYAIRQEDTSKSKMFAKIAEIFELQAEHSLSNTALSLSAGSFYESAVHALRRIPRAERERYNVDSRLIELQSKISKANKRAMGFMGTFRTTSDLSELVDHAESSVRGLTKNKALLAFVSLSGLANRAELEKMAEKSLGNNFFQMLFSATHLASDGRVLEKVPGINFSEKNDAGRIKRLEYEMQRLYNLHIQLTVTGVISPAIRSLNLEHHIDSTDLEGICQYSTLIPIERREIWQRGLMAGFEYDYLTSTHLLIPQIENVVRLSMKRNGLKTSKLNAIGVETENGLSALLDDPELDKAVSADWAFELRSLLTNLTGPNLRNELAHGLVDDSFFRTSAPLYFWWMCLRLVIQTIPTEEPS